MKFRTKKLVAIFLMLIVVLVACAGLITSLNGFVANADFIGYGNEPDKTTLYNSSNTYNVKEISENGVTYDLDVRNERAVMEESQITVLTPGLGGTAAHWSNAYPKVHENGNGSGVTYFAYNEDSIIHQLYMKAGSDAYVYWAKMINSNQFTLYDIINVENETYKADYEKYEDNLTEVVRIEDVSKPIIIVFESSEPVGSNDTVYYEFNYMLSNIVYDVSLHNPGNALPKVNLIGHSRGGITNLQYALDHPDLVDKLISLGTPYLGSEESLAFGELVVGRSEGLEDINTLSLSDGYYNRWNSNYERLYSDIDVTAIGAIASVMFVSEAVSMVAEGTPLRVVLEILVDGILSTVPGRLAIGGAAAVGTGIYALVELFWPDIQNYFSYEQVGYVWDILSTHIEGIIDPMWLGDILVPVDSAIGSKDGKSFKGFNRKIGVFDKFDGTDFNKRCVANLPVPHNLITMDQRFIDAVLNEISFDDTVVSEFSYTEKQDGTIKIDSYYGIKNSNFVIPSEIDGKIVTEIGTAAFAYAFLEDGVTQKVTIPATVIEIGDYAFLNNSGLKQVAFENGSQLWRVGNSAFSGCNGLTSAVLPSGVEEIGSMAFANCSSLAGTFVLPTAMTDYGVCAFVGCDNLTAFNLSAANQHYTVMDGVLYDVDNTTLHGYPVGKRGSNFVVPDTVTTISQYAFYGNESIVSVDLANVATIREGAFAECANLDTVLSESANVIEGFAFEGTKWYENNKNFASIGNVVYSYMGEDANIDFSGYFSISPYAAFGNSNIETITFNNAARNIGAFAFASCENLDTVYLNNLNNIVYVGTSSFDKTADNLAIYVPQRILNEYEDNELWQQYTSALEVHSTSVNYVLNGGNIGGQTSFISTVYYGGYMALPEPVRTGYIFEGWYESEDFSNDALADGKLWKDYSDNYVLYAKWVEGISEYTITYHLNGGSMSFTSQIYTEKDEIVYPIPEREGYRFIGWYHDKQLSRYAGEGFAAGNKGDLTLYARWDKEYELRYYDGYIHDNPKSVIEVEVKKPMPLLDAERDGYRFMGWYTTKDFINSSKITSITIDEINAAKNNIIDLYARWEKLYVVSFNTHGGTGVSSVIGIQGESIKLPVTTKTGYRGTWVSWGYLTGDTLKSNFGYDYIIGNSNVTLDVVWKQSVFTVTLNPNGGVGGSTTAKIGDGISATYTAPTRTGYTFNGYFTSITGSRNDDNEFRYKDGDGNIYIVNMNSNFNSSFIDGGAGIRYFNYDMSIAVDVEQMENTVLYACWVPNRYTVTIDKSGGTGGCDYFYAFYECRMTGFSSPKLDGYYYDHCEDPYGNEYFDYGPGMSMGPSYYVYKLTVDTVFKVYWGTTEELYPELTIVGKSGGTWSIRITNNTALQITVYYNSKMCNFNDAKNWTGLLDVKQIELKPHESVVVNINENWFATSIAVSWHIYLVGRCVTYADGLNTNGSMNIYHNII